MSLRKKLLDTFGAQVSSDHERYPADVKCLGFLYLYVGRYPRNNASRNNNNRSGNGSSSSNGSDSSSGSRRGGDGSGTGSDSLSSAYAITDNQAAQQMNEAKSKLFQTINGQVN